MSATDPIASAINKLINDAIIEYTNTLYNNQLLNCSLDEALLNFKQPVKKSVKKSKSKPEVIKSLPFWTPHHFDTCIALVGDCMAQCSLSKTKGEFCTACAKKCGDDGIPPNGTIFTRTSYEYTAPNGKSPKPFIDSTIYKKKIKDGESPIEIRQYYEDLHFDIHPSNWGDSTTEKPSTEKSNTDKPKSDKSKPEKTKSEKTKSDTTKNDKIKPDKKLKQAEYISDEEDELTTESPDIPDDSYEWSYQGFDYLAVDLPNRDKQVYDLDGNHIGIYNHNSKKLIRN